MILTCGNGSDSGPGGLRKLRYLCRIQIPIINAQAIEFAFPEFVRARDAPNGGLVAQREGGGSGSGDVHSPLLPLVSEVRPGRRYRQVDRVGPVHRLAGGLRGNDGRTDNRERGLVARCTLQLRAC